MALPMTVQCSVSSPFPSPAKSGYPRTFARFKPPPVSHPKLRPRRIRPLTIINAADETPENPEPETVSSEQSPSEPESRVGELGSEIREAMRQRKEEGREEGFWSGVAEEIREIEWPPFGKVLGTTGVVLGVIAGSSVVLLTVNAVLAELSDRVFAGRGVQDFFG
ncbi:hypothetical protein FH972_015652 [Carpinus fangiana]|uniref:Preprotein translocase subunit SECE1 n=1 Tax=Carpinus fangiana TaxID=176857 RepID=A0A5N6RGV4_9ROSI|nr:hypothetical protein FH972_015652 [Carpinus fangiana]